MGSADTIVPVLIVMAGLPGAGKSTLADALARRLGVPVLSVDPVEAAMWRGGVDRGQPTGLAVYVVVETVASGLLELGQSLIVDAVNDAPEARQQWAQLAERHGAPLRFVEVRCPDVAEHRRRLAGRRRGIEGFPEPTWSSVESRRTALEAWRGDRLVVDSTTSPPAAVDVALAYLGWSAACGEGPRSEM